MTARQSQSGQVLALGISILAVLSIGLLHFYALNKTIAVKTRLINGLDAAAYSGAVFQARTLNFLAYLNRAQIAHQVAMVHLISLGSWANYGATQASRLAMANPPAHLIGMLFGAEHGLAYTSAAKAAGLGLQLNNSGSLAQAFARHENFIHHDIKTLSQNLVTNLPAIRAHIMLTVLAANFPELNKNSINLQVSGDDWPGLLGLQAADNNMFTLLRQIAAMYSFLDNRNFTQKNNWLVDGRCPSLRHQLRRRGSTSLDSTGRWQASDTQSFHALRSNRWIGCYYREYVMGWAWLPPVAGGSLSDVYVEQPPEDFSQQDFWRWVRTVAQWSYLDDKANPLANSYAMRDTKYWPSRGLLPYYDVITAERQFATAMFKVKAKLTYTDNQSFSSSSAAQTSFMRPKQRFDKKRELANLFNPYWHASLAKGLLDDD